MEVWNGIWKKILVWNGMWKKILVWNGRFLVWNGKKIASMEYGKIVFHSIPSHALTAGSLIIRYESKLGSLVIKAFIATLDYDLD